MMKYTLEFKSDSYLKRFPFELEQLSSEDVIAYKAGDEVYISDYTPNLQGDHIQVALEEFDPHFDSLETFEKLYYCSASDIEIFLTEVSFAGENAQQFPAPRPSQVNLQVTHHSQLNNNKNPRGACNVTCVAMILNYYGVDSRTEAEIQQGVQREDILYQKTLEWDKWNNFTGLYKSRHKPHFLIRLLHEWGDKYGNGALQDSYFTKAATEEEIKQHLAKGNPVIVHGYFTAGHIIVVKGYDDTTREWICNDPYGKWLGYKGGYDNAASGDSVRYTYEDFYRVCDIDGIWCHFPIPRLMRLSQPAIKGSEIRKLQSRLKQKGFAVEETGLYDENTEAIVKEFQQQNNLEVDGIVGAKTWGKLFTSLA